MKFFLDASLFVEYALTLVLSLTACGSKSDSGSSAPAETPAETPAESTGSWAPDGPVTMIVSYKAGNGTDQTARILAQYAEKYIGQTIVIDNVDGGSGSIGWSKLADADADGMTSGFLNLPNFNSSIVNELGTYTVDDFKAICNHVTETSIVVVRADEDRFTTLGELGYYDQWLGSSRCIAASAGVSDLRVPPAFHFETKKFTFMKMQKTDIGVVAVMYAVCALFFYMNCQLKPESRTYPNFTIGLLFGLTTLYLVQMLFKAKNHGVESGVDKVFDGFQVKQFTVCFLLVIAYLVLMYYLGFYVSTIAFMIVTLLFLRVPLKHLVISVVSVNPLCYLAFSLFLGVKMPAGLLF